MPRTDLPITQVLQAGVAYPSSVAGDAANDHSIAWNDGRVFLIVVSTDAGAQTVTVITPGSQSSLAIEDLVVSVDAGATKLIGPLPPATFNQTDGKVHVDVTVATLAFRALHL